MFNKRLDTMLVEKVKAALKDAALYESLLDEISSLAEDEYDEGRRDGYLQGYDEGYIEGYDEGVCNAE